MKLIVLGSGTSVPHARRASSGYWLQTSGGSLLLDFSAPIVQRMAQENLDWPNLDAIWISHFHLDHSAGLTPFLFSTKHSPQTQNRRHPLAIYGPAGVEQFYWSFQGANDYDLRSQPFPLEIREVAPFADFQIFSGVRARTFKTPHTSESLALRIDDANGASLVFTADTGYTDELAEFARETDLFLMECTFWRDKPIDVHLELTDAMKLAQLSNARRVVLSHLDPVWDTVDLTAEVGKLWNGETIEAKDGLRLDIGSTDKSGERQVSGFSSSSM